MVVMKKIGWIKKSTHNYLIKFKPLSTGFINLPNNWSANESKRRLWVFFFNYLIDHDLQTGSNFSPRRTAIGKYLKFIIRQFMIFLVSRLPILSL